MSLVTGKSLPLLRPSSRNSTGENEVRSQYSSYSKRCSNKKFTAIPRSVRGHMDRNRKRRRENNDEYSTEPTRERCQSRNNTAKSLDDAFYEDGFRSPMSASTTSRQRNKFDEIIHRNAVVPITSRSSSHSAQNGSHNLSNVVTTIHNISNMPFSSQSDIFLSPHLMADRNRINTPVWSECRPTAWTYSVVRPLSTTTQLIPVLSNRIWYTTSDQLVKNVKQSDTNVNGTKSMNVQDDRTRSRRTPESPRYVQTSFNSGNLEVSKTVSNPAKRSTNWSERYPDSSYCSIKSRGTSHSLSNEHHRRFKYLSGNGDRRKTKYLSTERSMHIPLHRQHVTHHISDGSSLNSTQKSNSNRLGCTKSQEEHNHITNIDRSGKRTRHNDSSQSRDDLISSDDSRNHDENINQFSRDLSPYRPIQVLKCQTIVHRDGTYTSVPCTTIADKQLLLNRTNFTMPYATSQERWPSRNDQPNLTIRHPANIAELPLSSTNCFVPTDHYPTSNQCKRNFPSGYNSSPTAFIESIISPTSSTTCSKMNVSQTLSSDKHAVDTMNTSDCTVKRAKSNIDCSNSIKSVQQTGVVATDTLDDTSALHTQSMDKSSSDVIEGDKNGIDTDQAAAVQNESDDTIVDMDFLKRQRQDPTYKNISDLPICQILRLNDLDDSIANTRHSASLGLNKDLELSGNIPVSENDVNAKTSLTNEHEQSTTTTTTTTNSCYWTQLLDLARRKGLRIELQTRAGFTGKCADLFLFENYVRVDNHVFTGTGKSFFESQEKCAENALSFLNDFISEEKARVREFTQLVENTATIETDLLDCSKSRLFNQSFSRSKINVVYNLRQHLLSVLIDTRNQQLSCNCYRPLKNATKSLLRSIYRLAQSDKRICGATPVAETYRMLSTVIPCLRCFTQRASQLSDFVTQIGDLTNCSNHRTNTIVLPNRQQCLNVIKLLIFCKHWPSTSLIQDISKQIKHCFPWTEIIVPQLHSNTGSDDCLLNYLKSMPSAFNEGGMSDGEKGLGVTSSMDKSCDSSTEEKSQLLGQRRFTNKLQNCFKISLYFIQPLERQSRLRKSPETRFSYNESQTGIARALPELMPRPVISAVPALTDKSKPLDAVSCRLSHALLVDIRKFERRIKKNSACLDVLRVLTHLCNIHNLLEIYDRRFIDNKSNTAERFRNEKSMSREHMNRSLSCSSNISTEVHCSSEDKYEISDINTEDEHGKITVFDLECLIDYWMKVRSDCCLEWLFHRCIQTLAFGDQLPVTQVSFDEHFANGSMTVKSTTENVPSHGYCFPQATSNTDQVSGTVDTLLKEGKHVVQSRLRHPVDTNTARSATSSLISGHCNYIKKAVQSYSTVQELAISCCKAMLTGNLNDLFTMPKASAQQQIDISEMEVSDVCESEEHDIIDEV